MHVIGDILAGRYRIDAVLGSGGMGGVYQATQITLDKPFAIKEMQVVIPNPKMQEAVVAQFKVEAQILHSLGHPGLPHLYDFFVAEGKNYLVMELIRGSTLESVVSRNAVSEMQLLRWAHELCAVLNYLHTHDPPVIFRDLKPSNIMLTSEGHIKLIDFGIAKVWDAPDVETLTRTGIRGLCTPGFAAPEQYGSGTDVRTDIYALGATLYSLFTKTVPPPSVDLASGRSKLVPIHDFRPEITEKTVHVIDWMMKLGVAERPQTIAHVMEAFGFNPLQSPLDSSPQTDSRYWLGDNLTTLSATGSRPARKTRIPTWAVAAAAALLAALAAVASWRAWHHAPQSNASPSPAAAIKLMMSALPDQTKLFDAGNFVGYLGRAASLVPLPPGHHSLTFRHEGYADQRQEVDVGSRTPAFHVDLAPLMGTLELTGTRGAQLTVDGQADGVLPLRQAFEAGSRHVLKASKAGYVTDSTSVLIKQGQVQRISLVLKPQAKVAAHHTPSPPAYHAGGHRTTASAAYTIKQTPIGPFTWRHRVYH